ncbi:MAG: hypothetical protein EPO32_03650 [Anaerolineae bacterium]|nr:MAG: hypothetical protein EPO32_03650 [Anaerolineae bacterium]
MLDDSSSFLDDLESELNENSSPAFFDDSEAEAQPVARPSRRRSGGGKRLFGLTGIQRMVISMLFFGVVCMLSTGFLLVAGKISF